MEKTGKPRIMKENIKRFGEKLKKEEDLLIVSHHDADGITSCAILINLFKSLGKNVEFTIIKQLDSTKRKDVGDMKTLENALWIPVNEGIFGILFMDEDGETIVYAGLAPGGDTEVQDIKYVLENGVEVDPKRIEVFCNRIHGDF